MSPSAISSTGIQRVYTPYCVACTINTITALLANLLLRPAVWHKALQMINVSEILTIHFLLQSRPLSGLSSVLVLLLKKLPQTSALLSNAQKTKMAKLLLLELSSEDAEFYLLQKVLLHFYLGFSFYVAYLRNYDKAATLAVRNFSRRRARRDVTWWLALL